MALAPPTVSDAENERAADAAMEEPPRTRRLQLCVGGADVEPSHGAETPCFCPGASTGVHLVDCQRVLRLLASDVAEAALAEAPQRGLGEEASESEAEELELCACPNRDGGFHLPSCSVMESLLRGEEREYPFPAPESDPIAELPALLPHQQTTAVPRRAWASLDAVD